MAFLIQLLRIYGWYVAAVVSLGLVLASVVWLRAWVARWRKNRVPAELGRSSHPAR
jgi:membrane protein implicated in regulation of membrane protease activity